MFRSSDEVEKALLAHEYVYREEFVTEQSRTVVANNGVMLRTLLVLHNDDPELFYSLGVFGVPNSAPQSLVDLAMIASRLRRFVLGSIALHGGDFEGEISGGRGAGASISFQDVSVRDLGIFLRELEQIVRRNILCDPHIYLSLALYRFQKNGMPYVPRSEYESRKGPKLRI